MIIWEAVLEEEVSKNRRMWGRIKKTLKKMKFFEKSY